MAGLPATTQPAGVLAEPGAAADAAAGSAKPGLSARLATAVHLATLAGAMAFWVWLDRGLWFFGDEWQYLTLRGIGYWPGDQRSIWFPHNEHWSTLPILLWRGLYSIFHLSSYWPYLVPVLLAQVAVMHLAWRLCLRAQVDPWVATAAVALLGFLGAGAEDLAWAFQIGFVGSVMFGLIAFLLIDGPARVGKSRRGRRPAPVGESPPPSQPVPIGKSPPPGQPASPYRPSRAGWTVSRRDALASAALLASLMCSTTGDAMLIGGAVLLFARRPARRAAAVLALPVASYAVWFAFIGRLGLSSRADQFRLSTFTGLPAYVWTGLSSALGKAFNLEEAGAAILVVLIAWLIWQSGTLWHLHPCLLGLSAAAVMFYVLAAVGRDELGDPSAVSRYVYVTIAILVPVVAKILSPSASWPAWRGTCLAATVLLAATALGNVGQAQSYLSMRLALVGNLKADTFAAARLLASGVRDVAGPGAQPIMYEPNLSAAVLARLERSHLLPSQRLSPVQLVNARTVLSVALSPRPLSSGRFAFLGNAYSVQSRRTVHGGQCMVFSPQAVSQPMQVWLQIRRGEGSASARISTVPASSSLTNYLAAVIVPAGGPATTRPAELAVPPGGSAYVNYNDPGAKLALLWTQGTPLTVCGLLHGAGSGG